MAQPGGTSTAFSPESLHSTLSLNYFVKGTKKKKLDSVFSNREKLKKIDYSGMLLSYVSLFLILESLSGGGATLAWHATFVIVMLIVGGVWLLVLTEYE